jgi:DNA mismatch repair protein MutL
VKATLGKFSITPSLDFEVEPTFDFRPPTKGQPIVQPQIKFNPDYNPFDTREKQGSPRQESNRQNWEKLYPEKDFAKQFTDQPHIENNNENKQLQADFAKTAAGDTNLFQLHRQYILSQVKSGIMLIDQQKAHERILYERYFELLGTRSNLSQQELFPIKLSLSAADAELLNEIMGDLNSLGFGIKASGQKNFQYLINSTPAGLADKDAEGTVLGIIENYKQNLIGLNLDKRVNLARSMAKNLSIKTGRILQQPEMKNIIDELFACKMPEIDLDGQAIIMMITLAELEQRFRNK